MTQKFLPYGRQWIEEDDIQAVAEVLRGDYLTTGPKVAEFEERLCQITGAQYAVAVSNGTTALHLACIAAELGPGDIAIVPTITFLATANAVRYCGADIVFADVDSETGLMTPETLLDALKHAGNKAKAVIPVHLAGQCVDIESIKSIADGHNLKIITDACHALGSEDNRGHRAGSCISEDMACFSFHPVKTIAMGEGGAITTNDPDIAKRLKRLRHHGMDPQPDQGPWFYEMPELGYNYRLTDMQCALGVSQLKKLNTFLTKRQKLFDLYVDKLKPLAPIVRPPQIISQNRTGWHLFAGRFDFMKVGMTRSEFMNSLKEHGIGTQVHYIPVHTQPYYRDLYNGNHLSGAHKYYEGTLSLPLFPSMNEDDVHYVVKQIASLVRN